MRDLTRAREDMKAHGSDMPATAGRISFETREEYIPGKANGRKTYFRWLEGLRFEIPVQQIVFQEYVDMVKQRRGG